MIVHRRSPIRRRAMNCIECTTTNDAVAADVT